MNKLLIAATALAALAATPAMARSNVSVGLSIGAPVYAAPVPVYYQPAPVYYQPAPVVYYPPVHNVYYAPRPVAYGYGWGRDYRHDRFRHGYNTAWNDRRDDHRGWR